MVVVVHFEHCGVGIDLVDIGFEGELAVLLSVPELLVLNSGKAAKRFLTPFEPVALVVVHHCRILFEFLLREVIQHRQIGGCESCSVRLVIDLVVLVLDRAHLIELVLEQVFLGRVDVYLRSELLDLGRLLALLLLHF